MRYWSHGPVKSSEAMRAVIERNLTGEGEPANAFVVARNDGSQVFGLVDLYSIKNGNAGAGYIFAKQEHRRGYARESMTALLDYAFHERALHRVFLDIDPENTASIRLAQSMGFRWEAHLKENFLRDGVYLDSVYYAMLAREWQAAVRD
jgi:RimJ/RimL family protein N-acetyltransferase